MDSFNNDDKLRVRTLTLCRLFKRGDKNKAKEELLNIIQNSSDPYESAAEILKKAENKKSCYSICPAVLEILQSSFSERGVSQEVKRSMLAILVSFQLSWLQSIIRTFKLNEPCNFNLVYEAASKLDTSKEYLKLAYMIQAFNLHSEYYTVHVFKPLLVKNEIGTVQQYMKGNEEAQHYYLSLLDSWLLDGIDESQFKEIDRTFLDKKKLFKLTSRWNESYNSKKKLKLVNLELFQPLSYLKYTLHQYYTESGMSGPALEGVVLRTINNNKVLLKKVLQLIKNCHNDHERATRLERRFAKEEENNVPIWSDHEDDHDLHLQLNYRKENVLMVDSVQKLVFVESELFSSSAVANETILGFDAEYTRLVTDPNVYDIALIQIASNDKVYLLDVCYFRDANKMENLEQLVTNIFSSSLFVILGFGAKFDFKLLRKEFERFPDEPYCFVDLVLMKQSDTLTKCVEKQKMANSSGVEKRGLSKLCLQVLGQSLDKKEQMSDWAKRPLREKQVTYAALDAACLLKIYQKLNESLADRNFLEVWRKEMKSQPKIAKVENKKENVARPNNPDRVGEHTLSKSTVSG